MVSLPSRSVELIQDRPVAERARERVLVFHPAQLVADALALLIATQAPELEVCQITTEDEALATLSRQGPFGLVLWCMDGHTGMTDVLNRIRTVQADAAVAFLTDNVNPAMLDQAMIAGVSGLIPVKNSGRLTVNIIRLLLAGGTYVPACSSPETPADESVSAGSPPDKGEARLGLSMRQSDVLRLIARGASNKAIARELGMRENTVKTHVKQIMRRLGVRNRTEAALVAIRAAR
ncbi:MAG TPA: response regulator transcription factor [Alphaproteobacteria bacterium]